MHQILHGQRNSNEQGSAKCIVPCDVELLLDALEVHQLGLCSLLGSLDCNTLRLGLDVKTRVINLLELFELFKVVVLRLEVRDEWR